LHDLRDSVLAKCLFGYTHEKIDPDARTRWGDYCLSPAWLYRAWFGACRNIGGCWQLRCFKTCQKCPGRKCRLKMSGWLNLQL